MSLIEISAELDYEPLTPVRLPLPADTPRTGALQLRPLEGGAPVPAQRDGANLIAMLGGHRAGRRRRYRVEPAVATGPQVTVKPSGEHRLDIVLPEGPFSSYHFPPDGPRPYLYPVLGPGGKPVTRTFPMMDVAEEKAAGDQDHPHHRSFWTAYDEVNGTDNWSEGPKHGYTRHRKLSEVITGPVFGGFTAESTWTSREGKAILDETRTVRVYNAGADRRLVDYEVLLNASHGDVEYGDTKEGGLLAFRVFHTMKEKEGGQMQNSLGGVGEKACWGKRAAWLDYVGQVSGEYLGIAMMDHPGNHNHPCRWHARGYGLVGTNPFATAAFEPGVPKTPYHQKKGDVLRFRYRVLLHRGDSKAARVDDAYHAWIQGPTGRTV